MQTFLCPNSIVPALGGCFLCTAVKQDDHPSQEAIDALHAQFTAAIRKLFDDHKHLLGPEWAKKELRIL